MDRLRAYKTYIVKLVHQRPVLFYSVLLVLIALISHVQWFSPFSILEYGDWQYRPTESVREQVSSWMTWVPFNNLGSANVLMSGFPLRGLAWGLITQLGFSYDIATKLTLFLPVALGGFLVPFWVARSFFKDTIVAFFVALFYGSTAYFLILQTGHLPIAVLYAFLPLGVWLLNRALVTNELRHWLLLGIAFCIGIFYEVRIMYIVTCILLLYLVVYVVTHRVKLRSYLKNIAIMGGFVALANVFWLIPTKLAAAQGIGDIAGRGLFGDALFSLQHSFTIMKWSWTGDVIDRTFVAQPVPAYMFIIPIIICIGLAVIKTYRKQILFYLSLTLIGLFLSKQSTAPFGALYGWLYDNFPGFILFREASKFYIVVAFGYFGLLGYGLLAIKQLSNQYKDKFDESKKRARQYYLYPLALIGITVVAGVNLVPTINTSLGNTFKNAQMPQDYVVLKKFIKDQPDFFRTYWVPRESWWGYYDNKHPKVRAVDILAQNWKELPVERGTGSGFDLAQSTNDVFSQSYSESLFRNASVKYVIVPLRDTANDDDFFGSYGDDKTFFTKHLDTVPFLKRLNIGTKDVVVYQNMSFRPYVSASTSLYQGDQATLLNVTDVVDPIKHDTTATDISDRVPAGHVDQLFDTTDDFALQGSLATQHKTVAAGSELQVTPKRSLDYSIVDGTLSMQATQLGNILINDKVAYQSEGVQHAESVELNQGWDYYFDVRDVLQPLDQKKASGTLGAVQEKVRLWTASRSNLIPNGSFIDGLWQKEVSDCNNYNDKAQLDMRLDPIGSGGNKNSLQLGAFSHTACTSQSSIPVKAGLSYLFGFDYQMNGGQKVGFRVTFDDPSHTSIAQDINTNDRSWHTFTRRVDAPPGAKSMTITVYGYPNKAHTRFAMTHYDKFRLSPLTERWSIDPQSTDKKSLPLTKGENTVSYNSATPFINQVSNGSLEHGLWKKQVSDCNQYDANPAIDMKLDESMASEGRKSLQLMAKRHTACTSPDALKVIQNNTYDLSFMYRSSSAKSAGYSLRFNDPLGTSKTERIAIKKSGWQKASARFTVPQGATRLSITLYAEPGTDGKSITVNYDDLQVRDVTALVDTMLATTPTSLQAGLPKHITFGNHAPTRKEISVQGARGPFYLAMNEAYHPGWRLEARNSRVVGFMNSWRPGVKPDMIAKENHYQANIAMNGWFIDTEAFCKNQSACTKNSDGSYDIKLIAEFAPQRVFYGGLIASVAAFAAAVAYIVLRSNWWKRRGKK